MAKFDFEPINREFFAKWADAQYFDCSVVVVLANGNVATFTVSERGTLGNYVGYDCRVINKSSGEIARHFFVFDDYLSQPDKTFSPRKGNVICNRGEDETAEFWNGKPTNDSIEFMARKMLAYAFTFGD